MMGFPVTSFCMGCHENVKKDSAAIQKLAAFARDNKPVPWVRVYQIPSFVDFSHRAHLNAGAKCDNCHGPVAERDVISKEGNTSMGACMDCHREQKASIDCKFCHDQVAQ
jgi:hypothetical protein